MKPQWEKKECSLEPLHFVFMRGVLTPQWPKQNAEPQLPSITAGVKVAINANYHLRNKDLYPQILTFGYFSPKQQQQKQTIDYYGILRIICLSFFSLSL